MSRVSLGMIVVLVVALLSSVAEASPNKRRRGRRHREKTPTSAAIAEAMGELEWGASRKQVTAYLVGLMKEAYRPQVQKTHDPMKKDELRRSFQEKVQQLKDSYVEFDGKSTGWDVSFLKGEFSHNNGESMLVRRDQNSQNFYFFMNGRLWKWYKAFDSAAFPFKKFDKFSSVVQKKFGRAKERSGDLNGEGRQWIEWEDRRSRVRAVDETEFYGFFSLVFEEKATLAKLPELRRRGSSKPRKRHALIESITGDGDPDEADQPNIVDQLTGKRRGRAGEGRKGRSRGAKAKTRGRRDVEEASAPPKKQPPPSLNEDDDPLKGIL